MDDITWITSSKAEMEEILNTAETFFQLNNFKVNPDKSSLIITHNTDSTQQINFIGKNIKPSDPQQPIRFLGVWITAAGSKAYQIDLIQKRVFQIAQTLARKAITDKQIRYIINHVLMPALEYLLQDLVLTEPECNTINSKIMQTFKHKIHLPTTAINSGIYMHTGYKIFNIYDRQLELHSKNLLNRLNSDNICK